MFSVSADILNVTFSSIFQKNKKSIQKHWINTDGKNIFSSQYSFYIIFLSFTFDWNLWLCGWAKMSRFCSAFERKISGARIRVARKRHRVVYRLRFSCHFYRWKFLKFYRWVPYSVIQKKICVDLQAIFCKKWVLGFWH